MMNRSPKLLRVTMNNTTVSVLGKTSRLLQVGFLWLVVTNWFLVVLTEQIHFAPVGTDEILSFRFPAVPSLKKPQTHSQPTESFAVYIVWVWRRCGGTAHIGGRVGYSRLNLFTPVFVTTMRKSHW